MTIPRFEDKWEEYNYYHALCPKCLGDDFEETNIGYTEPSKNPNKHTCINCSWKGYQHQLLPRNLEGIKKSE